MPQTQEFSEETKQFIKDLHAKLLEADEFYTTHVHRLRKHLWKAGDEATKLHAMLVNDKTRAGLRPPWIMSDADRDLFPRSPVCESIDLEIADEELERLGTALHESDEDPSLLAGDDVEMNFRRLASYCVQITRLRDDVERVTALMSFAAGKMEPNKSGPATETDTLVALLAWLAGLQTAQVQSVLDDMDGETMRLPAALSKQMGKLRKRLDEGVFRRKKRQINERVVQQKQRDKPKGA